MAWNTWREENRAIVPKLTGFALKLSERRVGPRYGGPINLKSAQLQRVAFCFADLSAAQLKAADLTGADLRHSCLNEANLSGADLSNAQLDHADLGAANLKNARLGGADLRLASLALSDLEGADLTGADLLHARFNGANLRAANFSSARLDHADFAGADLTGANLRGASLHHAKNLTRAQLKLAKRNRLTILPPHLQGSVSRSPARKQTGALASISPTRGDAGLGVPRLASSGVWMTGAVIAALIVVGLALKQRMEATSLATSIAQGGLDQPLRETSLDPGDEVLVLPASVIASEARVLHSTLATVDGAAPQTSRVFAVDLRQSAERGVDQPLREASLDPGDEVLVLPASVIASEARVLHSTLATVDGAAVDLRQSALSRPFGGIEGAEVTPLVAAASRIATLHDAAIRNLRTEDLVSYLPSIPGHEVAVLGPDAVMLRAALPPETLLPITKIRKVRTREIKVVPIEVKEERQRNKDAAETLVAGEGQSMTLVVSLRHQKLDIYSDTTLVTSSRVSSGMRGFETKAGVFSILEKRRHHHSNLYSGAPMPWMQRLTRTGTALHGGVVPSYPASHGCIRLPFSFAPKLFKMTEVGANVVVTGERVAPRLIDHPNLPRQLVSTQQAIHTQLVDASAEPAGSADSSARAYEEGGVVESSWSGARDSAVVEQRSTRPLRILVTRRTERDRLISIQHLLSSMGYLTPQNFTGRLGEETKGAIKAFQKANGMPETGGFTNDLVTKVYKVAGKVEPPQGHLYVRQDFNRVFDVPVAFRNPEQTLGTHVFTSMLDPGDTKSQWMAISLEGGDSASVLDRIEIPGDIRQKISERLAPGSTLIIADTSINSAILPEGDDFLVLAKDKSAEAEWNGARANNQQAAAKTQPMRLAKHGNASQARAKKVKAKNAKTTAAKKWQHNGRRYSYDRPRRAGRMRFFGRW